MFFSACASFGIVGVGTLVRSLLFILLLIVLVSFNSLALCACQAEHRMWTRVADESGVLLCVLAVCGFGCLCVCCVWCVPGINQV